MINANGITYNNEQAIFPLIVFEQSSENFKCIGTSFFINGWGVFVTARHVVEDELHQEHLMFVVQQLSNQQAVNRTVTHLCVHPHADIVVGMVGSALDIVTAEKVPFEVAPNFRLSFKSIPASAEILGFGYAKTEKLTNGNLHTFTFKGHWSEGIVEGFHPDGFSMLKNKCYQTTMRIDSGCSGGPVLKDGYVVGVNSSSFELVGDENPISFITPVEYLLDLQLPVDNELISIKEMSERRMIITDRF